MKKIFVCAGMNSGSNKNYEIQAKKLGELLAKNDCIYAQGGYASGLMGATLKSFHNISNKIEIYLPINYYKKDAPALRALLGDKNFKIRKVRSEAGRLKQIQRCDGIVVLPGGTGTLEELLYCNETSRASEHDNKIYLINIDGYYKNLIEQIDISIAEGMTNLSVIKYTILESVEELPFLKK